jgi:outer membrane murein-binding lipoprotein Lpp
MRSGGGSLAHLGLHIGEDWSTWLSTYPDHSPILDITAGSTTVAICITGNKADQAAVEFARELARQAAAFASEVERLHAGEQGGHGQAREDAGDGEAA